MPKDSSPKPEDTVMARRRRGYGDVVSPVHGLVREGDVIPMTWAEVMSREDFEPADAAGSTEHGSEGG